MAQQEYSLACHRLEKNTHQAKHLDDQLTNRTPTLLDDLIVRDASILLSLNHSLGTTHRTLSSEQKHAFVQFSQQFHTEDVYLMLGHPPERIALGDILHQRYNAEQTRQTMQNNLDKLNESIAHDKSRRDRLKVDGARRRSPDAASRPSRS